MIIILFKSNIFSWRHIMLSNTNRSNVIFRQSQRGTKKLQALRLCDLGGVSTLFGFIFLICRVEVAMATFLLLYSDYLRINHVVKSACDSFAERSIISWNSENQESVQIHEDAPSSPSLCLGTSTFGGPQVFG